MDLHMKDRQLLQEHAMHVTSKPSKAEATDWLTCC